MTWFSALPAPDWTSHDGSCVRLRKSEWEVRPIKIDLARRYRNKKNLRMRYHVGFPRSKEAWHSGIQEEKLRRARCLIPVRK